ncbi:MAG: DUF5683 domain-containing protein [candidate division Zixibacteria bacterium]
MNVRFVSIYSTLMLACVCSCSLCYASDEINPPYTNNGSGFSINQYLNEINSYSVLTLNDDDGNDKGKTLNFREGVQKEKKSSGHKSPVRAFIYSAIIPGAGQMYNGSKIKAVAFLGLEALAWTGHIIYNGKGDDKTTAYETYANTNWSEGTYSDWLEMHWGYRDDELVLNDRGFPLFTHHLPDTRTQQYYEMIGKYNQFVYGWADVNYQDSDGDPHPGTYSAMRMHYETMRHDANKMYDKATTSIVVSMINHVISGFEAALAARSHNKNLDTLANKVSVKAHTAQLNDEYFPMLTMTYKF